LLAEVTAVEVVLVELAGLLFAVVDVVEATPMLDRFAARSGQLPVIPLVAKMRRTEATTCCLSSRSEVIASVI
jgi:hypothetical protein